MFWLLVVSYWVHLLATVMWLGGLALWGVVGMPAFSQQTLTANQWLTLQKRFLPYANASLIMLLITGFVQMTNDPNYNGFLQVDSLWAGAMLVKHIAFVGMVAITAYMQARIYPAMERALLLMQKKSELGINEQTHLEKQEKRLLSLNLVCAAAVLFFTAIATAI
jgi:uncharacterized membrane protein